MKATFLVDNIPYENIEAEWGLSVYIEYENSKVLLDFGSTELMFENAKRLGINLEDVDFAVLSHGHFDHSGGIERFFNENKTAKLYLKSTKENCHAKKPFTKKRYNGIPKGVLENHKDRVEVVTGKTEIVKGVFLLGHTKNGLEKIGKKAHMYIEENGRLIPDDFSHEQSLVFETEKGLVIFNSCCHSGADTVINEAKEAFPNEKILALIGGFHLYDSPKRRVVKLAKNIEQTGIDKVYTGHCTGEKAFCLLKEHLGEKCNHFHTGLVLEF